jgi:hypothetical protein
MEARLKAKNRNEKAELIVLLADYADGDAAEEQ